MEEIIVLVPGMILSARGGVIEKVDSVYICTPWHNELLGDIEASQGYGKTYYHYKPEGKDWRYTQLDQNMFSHILVYQQLTLAGILGL